MSSPDNIDNNLIVNPLFVPLAIEAGIGTVIRSLVGASPMGRVDLVIALRTALWDSNRPLAEGINFHTLDAILQSLEAMGEGVAIDSKRVNPIENVAGPVGVFASYANGTLNVTWTDPPSTLEDVWNSQIIVDGVIVKYSTAQDDGDGNADDTVTIDLSAGDHTVRVIYVNSAGKNSLLGASATVTV